MIRLLMAFAVMTAGPAWAENLPICARHATVLREGPGAQYPVSWKVARYMPFMRLAEKGGWDKVRDVDGKTHWARKRDLTTGLSCVVVKVSLAYARSGPSRTSALAELHSFDRYTPLRRIGQDGPWVHVEDEARHKSWIHESLVWHPVRIESFSF